jgi:hemerythrin
LEDLFVWTEDLSVKVDMIDEQHRELLKQMNDFFRAVLSGKGLEQVHDAIDFLTAYVDLHFRTEEFFMRKYKYPLYDSHRKQHELLTAEVLKAAQRIKETEQTRDVIVGLASKMGGWILDHVLKVDKNLGLYLDSLEGSIDTRIPDDLVETARLLEPRKPQSDSETSCGHLEYCSKMFDNFLDDDSRQFWMTRFCRDQRYREECRRKQMLDRGATPQDVPKTMLPNGEHLSHLARS